MAYPPFSITPRILSASMRIAQQLGELEGLKLRRPNVSLRKSSHTQTIQASLAIEGNTLTLEQVTDLLEGVPVLGPPKDILEVKNAVTVYEQLLRFKYTSKLDFKRAHKRLMTGLGPGAGAFRETNVGVFTGSSVAHVAPQAKRVEALMEDLFQFLRRKDDVSLLVKACVFHYELEFIHPFLDGNGRMGRLWHHLILSAFHPVFEYVAIEGLIKEKQSTYYAVLAQSDKKGESTDFIEFCLSLVEDALQAHIDSVCYVPNTPGDRLEAAREHFDDWFSRKAYAACFKNISIATASRDLRLGVAKGVLVKKGDKNLTRYRFVKKVSGLK